MKSDGSKKCKEAHWGAMMIVRRRALIVAAAMLMGAVAVGAEDGGLCPWAAAQKEFEFREAGERLMLAPPPPPFVPPDGATNPMGVARGMFPGRVVWDYDPTACTWDGRYTNSAGVWISNNDQWLTNNTDQAKVDAMVSRCLRWLTGTTNESAAWQALFVHFNVERGLGSNGYVNGEGISIKPN